MGFVVLIALFIIITIILTWVNLFRINAAKEEIEFLKERIKSLQRALDAFTKRIDNIEGIKKDADTVKKEFPLPTRRVSEELKASKPVEHNIEVAPATNIPEQKVNEPALSKTNEEPDSLESEENYEIIEEVSELTKSDQSLKEEDVKQPVITQEPLSPKNEEIESKVLFEKQLDSKLDKWSVDKEPSEVEKNKTSETTQTVKEDNDTSFERQIGEKLTVWVGGVALALAGIFLVKYSIEKGYLNEKVRVRIGFLFGVALLVAGHIIRNKKDVANGTRISQALSGAGIATLYGVIYAATNIYHVTSDWVGFFGMAVVTATAVFLALKHGMPIALLGMVGGYLAPAFVGPNDPPAILMFSYLYLLLGGLLIMIRKKKWWGLVLPTAFCSFVWLFYWIASSYHPGDSLVLALFLFALALTIIYCTKDAAEDPNWSVPISVLNSLVFVVVMIFMTVIVDKADYGWMEWGFYALMSLGSIILSIYDEKSFKFAPWFSLSINAIILICWNSKELTKVPIVLIGFALIYIVASYLFLCRRKRPVYWGTLAVVTSLGYFMLAYYKLNDTEFMKFIPFTWSALSLIMGAFLVVSIMAFEKIYVNDENKNKLLMIFYPLIGAFMALTLTIEIESNFHWELFGLIGAGAVALAFYDTKTWAVAPFLAMLVSAWALFNWHADNSTVLALTILVFAVIYALPSLYFYWKKYTLEQWSGLLALTTICYYLLAYFKLHELSMFSSIPFLWGLSALVLAGFAFVFLRSVMNSIPESQLKDKLLTIFTVSTTTFVSLALTIELEKDFLPVAFTMEMLAIAWINNRVAIKCLRSIVGIIAVIFVVLLVPQILVIIQSAFNNVLELGMKFQTELSLVQWPMFQLGLPAVMFVAASLFLKKQKDDQLVQIFEYVSVILVVGMGYFLSRHFFHAPENILTEKPDFFERSVITNLFFAISLICFFVGRLFDRASYSKGASFLYGISLARLIYFDFIIHNPLWAHQKIEGILIFNTLAVTYGFSIFWVLIGCQELKKLGETTFAKIASKLPLLLLFIWSSYNVRFYFHQPYLNQGSMSNAEIYSYSATWLVLGVGLLIAGIVLKSQAVRFASLAMMILTVGKAFLYDARELEGLLRVGSFLGLGLSLIGLSYFYTKYVFGKKAKEPQRKG